jgi:acetate kinase
LSAADGYAAHFYRGRRCTGVVIPTNEELMIAQHTLALVRP